MKSEQRRREQLMRKLREEHAELFLRNGHTPRFRIGDGDLAASKIAGTPWMPAGQPWPRCKGCKALMYLVLQLDLGALPAAPHHREGELVQLFFCGEIDCARREVTPSPGGRGFVLRVVSVGGSGGQHADAARAAERHRTPAQVMEGWDALVDVRAIADVEDVLGGAVGAGGAFNAKEYRMLCDEEVAPSRDHKLGGWPAWVQNPSWPSCPTCNKRRFSSASTMELLYQLPSEDRIPASFGDLGMAFVLQCKHHIRRLAVGVQST